MYKKKKNNRAKPISLTEKQVASDHINGTHKDNLIKEKEKQSKRRRFRRGEKRDQDISLF